MRKKIESQNLTIPRDRTQKKEESPQPDLLMHDLARFIDRQCQHSLKLKDLAQQVHLSSSYLQRRFKAAIGVSPQEYLEFSRLKKLKSELHESQLVTQAIFEAGYGSMSQVYEKSNAWLGMTPREYQKKGSRVEISYAFAQTLLGKILLGATDRGICFLQFGSSQKNLLALLKKELPKAKVSPMREEMKPMFNDWMKRLDGYLQGRSQLLDLPLDLQGTAFQTQVWKYLLRVPPGQTQTYKMVAKALKLPKGFRAVARACASNKIAIVVPCHRIIRGDGHLAGYRWGIKRKIKLLDLEKGISNQQEAKRR